MLTFILNRINREFEYLRGWFKEELERELRDSESRIRSDISEVLEKLHQNKSSEVE